MSRAKRRSRTSRPPRRSGAPSDPLAPRSALATWFLRLFPVVIAGGGVVLYFVAKTPQGAGIAVVSGAIVWLVVGLSTLGAEVPPRDRTRASAIDFGKRN